MTLFFSFFIIFKCKAFLDVYYLQTDFIRLFFSNNFQKKSFLLDLNDFIDRADEGLMTQAQEGDYKALIRVMEYLQVKQMKNFI